MKRKQTFVKPWYVDSRHKGQKPLKQQSHSIVAPSAIFNFHKFRGKYRLRSMIEWLSCQPEGPSRKHTQFSSISGYLYHTSAKPPKIDTDRCEAFTYMEPKPSCQGYLPLSAVVPRKPGRHYFVMRLNSNSCVYCPPIRGNDSKNYAREYVAMHCETSHP